MKYSVIGATALLILLCGCARRLPCPINGGICGRYCPKGADKVTSKRTVSQYCIDVSMLKQGINGSPQKKCVGGLFRTMILRRSVTSPKMKCEGP